MVPDALQRAADRAVEAFPEFAHTIRSGFFWNYREDAGLRPMVHEENQTPCQPLYSANVHELLLDISYYRRRINFEIFHAIADGLGASVFFRALVLFYLEEVHPDLEGCGGTEILTGGRSPGRMTPSGVTPASTGERVPPHFWAIGPERSTGFRASGCQTGGSW